MIDINGQTFAAIPSKLGRPWHGLVANSADGLTATLTLGNSATSPWPAPITNNDAWLLRPPVARARLIAQVFDGPPGELPPPDAPDWPLTTAAESAAGMRYLDHSLQPWGTGAGGFLVAYAADLTPWMLGIASVTVESGEMVWQVYARPFGSLGAAPVDWVAITPHHTGADRLPIAPYQPPPEHVTAGPLVIEYAALLSVSSDGRRWLMAVTAESSYGGQSIVLGLYEMVLSGGVAGQVPVWELIHHSAWADVAGTYDAAVGYTGITVHAWYDTLDEVRPIALAKTRDPDDGGVRGSLTWTLSDGERELSRAHLNLNATCTLNGSPLPGSAAGEYLITAQNSATQDVRARTVLAPTVHVSAGVDRELWLRVMWQSQSLVGLVAAATSPDGADIAGVVWLGVGTPTATDPAVISGTATVISSGGGSITYDLDRPHGSTHPVTGDIVRQSVVRITFA